MGYIWAAIMCKTEETDVTDVTVDGLKVVGTHSRSWCTSLLAAFAQFCT